MARRPPTIALEQAAAMLGVETREAREYLRAVQRKAGQPVPYAVIVEAMSLDGPSDRGRVAEHALSLLGAITPHASD